MIFRRVGTWPSRPASSLFDELNRMRRQMEWLSESLTGSQVEERGSGVYPLMNLTEDADCFYVRIELPGILGSDLDISVTGDSFSIAGERKITLDNEGVKYHRREREEGKFSRIISLPTRIDTNGVEAHSENGVLTVKLPKAEEAKPKQITIKTS